MYVRLSFHFDDQIPSFRRRRYFDARTSTSDVFNPFRPHYHRLLLFKDEKMTEQVKPEQQQDLVVQPLRTGRERRKVAQTIFLAQRLPILGNVPAHSIRRSRRIGRAAEPNLPDTRRDENLVRPCVASDNTAPL